MLNTKTKTKTKTKTQPKPQDTETETETEKDEKKIWHVGKAYWSGPYDCLVPWHMKSCCAADGGNICGRTGSQTEMYCLNPPSRVEWLKQHTAPDETGRHIYVA